MGVSTPPLTQLTHVVDKKKNKTKKRPKVRQISCEAISLIFASGLSCGLHGTKDKK